MSENPYAPPASDLGEPLVAVEGGSGDFDVGRCLSDAWVKTWAHFPLWLGVGIVGFLAALLASLTVVGVFVVVPVLGWGAIRFCLRMHDGGAEFGDLFAGFSVFGAALVGILGVGLLTLLVALAGQSVQFAADRMGEPWLLVIGVPLNLVVGLLITPRLFFAYLYVVDRGMAPMEALRHSWQLTSPVKWKVVVLMLLNYVVLTVGLLALLIGLIPASVIVYLMWISAFRQLAGRATPA